MSKILIATHNKHKVEEITSFLQPLGFFVMSFNDIPDAPITIEDQPSMEGNALKKAREAYAATGILTLADDSGLEVYYLEMQPGVYSARSWRSSAKGSNGQPTVLWKGGSSNRHAVCKDSGTIRSLCPPATPKRMLN